MRLRYILLVLLAAAGLAAWAGYLALQQALETPGPLAQPKIIYVEPGSSTAEISTLLIAEGVTENSPFLTAYGAKKDPGVLKAGEYEMPARVSIREAMRIIKSGKTYQRRITIPEGMTSAEIVDLVNAAEVMDGKVDFTPPEGSLLPETYNYTRGEARKVVLTRMRRKMQATLEELWPRRAEGLPLKTPEEAVTLASIVEKETGVPAERARIAGVFYNRLKAGMPLQSDPTVIYALTEGRSRLGRLLTRNDLNYASPYNTYTNAGLPPAPIANPGRASLEAVLNPEQNDFIYFVADGTGGHAFAKSLDQHNHNVAKWREVRRQAE